MVWSNSEAVEDTMNQYRQIRSRYFVVQAAIAGLLTPDDSKYRKWSCGNCYGNLTHVHEIEIIFRTVHLRCEKCGTNFTWTI